jgi:hypothetical protein
MTEAQIESLAAERLHNATVRDGFDSTYLRVIITAVQAKLGDKVKGRRLAAGGQLKALDDVNAPFYAAVLRGVTTPEIAADPSLPLDAQRLRTLERNRRSTFARTAKSTLVSWIREGGDIRAIDVMTVSKGELRASVNAARTDGEEPQSRVERAQAAIISHAQRQAPEAARETLEEAIEALQAALAQLDKPAARRERMGVQLHA